MRVTSIVLSLIGAIVTTVGAVWLAAGFSPTNPRYVDDGLLYPGRQRSRVVPNLLADQRRVSALIAAGAALQLIGVTFATLAN